MSSMKIITFLLLILSIQPIFSYDELIYLDNGETPLSVLIEQVKAEPYGIEYNDDYFIAAQFLCYKGRDTRAAKEELESVINEGYLNREGYFLYQGDFFTTEAYMIMEEIDIFEKRLDEYIRIRYFVHYGHEGGRTEFQYIPRCDKNLSLDDLSHKLKSLTDKLDNY